MGKSGENLGGGLLYLQRKHGKSSERISEQISGKISETSFQISRVFFSQTSFSRRANATATKVGALPKGWVAKFKGDKTWGMQAFKWAVAKCTR